MFSNLLENARCLLWYGFLLNRLSATFIHLLIVSSCFTLVWNTKKAGAWWEYMLKGDFRT